jgi:hypothetical protein
MFLRWGEMRAYTTSGEVCRVSKLSPDRYSVGAHVPASSRCCSSLPRPRHPRVGCTSQDSMTREPRTLLCASDVHGHTRDNPAGLGMPLASRRLSSTRKRTRKVAWLCVTFVEHFEVTIGRRAHLVVLAARASNCAAASECSSIRSRTTKA